MQFVLDNFNYWIIILLMMGGLYIIFESQNLIKRLVGLSIFQTSVIILYITLGKIKGGTAPIYIDNGHHDAGEGEHATDAHGAHAAPEILSHDGHAEVELSVEAGHHAPEIVSEHVAENADHALEAVPEIIADTHNGLEHNAVEEIGHSVGHGVDAAHSAVVDVIYTNPLPHVLMLTAIVVGVATLAVGLALVVRIREAYGTIEMDDVVAADIAASEIESEKA